MLKNIKSLYFTKVIFSFVKEGKKLKLAKYNNNLKQNIDISLINYKFYSIKYIIYESKGNGKEYDDGVLVFEGEYLNGERNGKGKEFNICGKLAFEGEYLNGKINGKGKEYDYNGKLRYKGEYLNGLRNGKGKEYDYDGKLRFEGEYLNGKINCKGKEYDYRGILLF